MGEIFDQMQEDNDAAVAKDLDSSNARDVVSTPPSGASPLEMLRIPENYYGDYGSQWLSNSAIKTLLDDPTQFGKEDSDKKHYHEGRLFHQLLLEPEKDEPVIINATTRNTKVYKEHSEKHGFALLAHEADTVRTWVAAIKANLPSWELLYGYDGETKYEEPAVGEIMGYPFKGKADVVRVGDTLVDPKTHREVQWIRSDVHKLGYSSQAYIYRELFGLPMIFLVYCKKTGQIHKFTCSEQFYQEGKDRVERALEVYDKYFVNKSESLQNRITEGEF